MADALPAAPDPADRAPDRARRRRLLRRLAIALALILAVVSGSWYALFFWAKSSGRLESWLARRPERFQLRWTELRSPLPFVFEARGLVIDVRTRRRSWELTAESARASIDPFALAGRRFVLRDARASGAELRLVNEPTPETAGSERGSTAAANGEHRPRITAFAEGPLPARIPRKKPWSWIVSEIEVEDLREVWIDDVRMNGSASGRLGFALERREWAEFSRSRLRIEKYRVTIGGGQLGEGLDGELDLQVFPWRYHGAGAEEFLSRLQGTIALRGEATLGPALHFLFGDRPWLEIGADRSKVELALTVDRGRLRAGSHVDATLVEPELAAFGFVARGHARLTAEVNGEPVHEKLHSRLLLDDWTLARPGEAARFSGDGLSVDAELDAPRIDQKPKGGALTIDLGRGRADDLRFIDAFLPKSAGVNVEGGTLELGGKLTFDAGDQSGSGEVALSGSKLALAIRGQRFGADLAVDLKLARPDLAAGSFALDGSKLALKNVAAATSAGATIESWWGESELVSGRVTLKKPFESSGEFKARFADTRPVIAFYELKRDLPGWVEKALLLEDVRLSGKYRATPGRIKVSDARLPFANGEARAELDLTKERRRARLLLAWRKLSLGLELDNAKRDLHLLRAREWFEKSGGAPR